MRWTMASTIAVLAVALALLTGALAGCTGGTPAEPAKPAEPGSPAEPQKRPMVLRAAIGTEPQYIDPNRATGIPDNTVTLSCFEGLTRLNGAKIMPACAESWDVDETG
ncbi:MAG: hypothetical protein ACM3WT_04875, partial [Bacillota bacterium]